MPALEELVDVFVLQRQVLLQSGKDAEEFHIRDAIHKPNVYPIESATTNRLGDASEVDV